MSSSSLSMAAASFSFSPLRNKHSSLRFQPITFPTTHFPPKFLYHKTKNHPNFPSFFLISRSIPAIAAAFHEFSVESDEEPDDPLTETETEEVDEEEEEQEVIKQSSEVGRLYVGNLPYAMTSSQLAEVFGEAGRVDNVEIVYDRVTDRSRGFAFVTMGSIEDAKEAIRIFDGSQVGGRTVKVNFPEVPKGGEREVMRPKIRTSNSGFVDTPYKIYAGNLGWGLSSQGLGDAFADQPGFLSAKIIYDRDSGKSRGFGFVSFSSAEQAESALNAMNGVEVEGRPLRLNMAAERARPLSAPVIERTPEKSVDSNEILSSVST